VERIQKEWFAMQTLREFLTINADKIMTFESGLLPVKILGKDALANLEKDQKIAITRVPDTRNHEWKAGRVIRKKSLDYEVVPSGNTYYLRDGDHNNELVDLHVTF
jgi:hypothetical protein